MDANLSYLAIAYGGFFLLLAFYLRRIVRRDEELHDAIEALAVTQRDST